MDEVDFSSVKFRASSVGNLMVGGNAITDKQLERLKELDLRKQQSALIGNDGKPLAKPLTAGMEAELAELIEKRDGEFKFGSTAMSYIRECWLRDMYGYDEPVVTNELIKGISCEQEAIGVLTRQISSDGFRIKNEDRWEDEHFMGTPDVISDSHVEDIKCSWTLRTFFETTKPDPIYYAQGQVYMALTRRTKFRLVHILVDTPFELVEEEKKRFYFRFNCDEENPHYREAIRKIEAMHYSSSKIPESHRIKCFEFERNDDYIRELRSRVELARKIYYSLSLGSGYDI